MSIMRILCKVNMALMEESLNEVSFRILHVAITISSGIASWGIDYLDHFKNEKNTFHFKIPKLLRFMCLIISYLGLAVCSALIYSGDTLTGTTFNMLLRQEVSPGKFNYYEIGSILFENRLNAYFG